jgi:hypothetical protein
LVYNFQYKPKDGEHFRCSFAGGVVFLWPLSDGAGVYKRLPVAERRGTDRDAEPLEHLRRFVLLAARTPFNTAIVRGAPARRINSSVVATVSRSNTLGRQGMITKSAALTAAIAAASARGGVSTTNAAPLSAAEASTCARRAGCALTTTGGAFSRRSAHVTALACGSRSMIAAGCPASSDATARPIARTSCRSRPFAKRAQSPASGGTSTYGRVYLETHKLKLVNS